MSRLVALAFTLAFIALVVEVAAFLLKFALGPLRPLVAAMAISLAIAGVLDLL